MFLGSYSFTNECLEILIARTAEFLQSALEGLKDRQWGDRCSGLMPVIDAQGREWRRIRSFSHPWLHSV